MTYSAPVLPEGRVIPLPDRGRTFVRMIRHPYPAPTVLLLHGWTATADLNWHAVYAAVGERANVLALDHRGHGRGLRSGERFTLEAAADDAAALVREIGCGPVVACGYSMGGPVAQLLWRRHPTLVSGLVLCATAPVFTGLPWERVTFAGLPAITRLARLTPHRLRARIALGLIAGDDDWPLREWAREQVIDHDWVEVLQAGRALGAFDSRGWSGTVDVPTAIVTTLNDRVVLPERQLRLAAEIPGARIHEVAGAHDVVLAEPERFVPRLLAALDDVTTPSLVSH